jgi:hypothetical protein
MKENEIGTQVVDCAVELHRNGVLDSGPLCLGASVREKTIKPCAGRAEINPGCENRGDTS